jgi:hypothetical protein
VKSALSIFSGSMSSQLIDLVKDEVNVKSVAVDSSIEKDVELDVTLTPELKLEGDFRELLRKVQDMRKEKCLSVGDKAVLVVPETERQVVDKYSDEIKKLTNVTSISFGEKLGL